MVQENQTAAVVLTSAAQQAAGAETALVAESIGAFGAGSASANAPPLDPAEDAEALSGPRKFPAVDPDAIRQAFEAGRYPYARQMGRVSYRQGGAGQLLKVQIWAQETGQKFVILMEGRDAAGKSGTIKRFMEHLNPRYARTVALSKPSDAERASGSFNATSSICPLRAKWCSRPLLVQPCRG